MRTQTLIDVPKDSPSRQQKLNALKRALGIETHYAKHLAREDLRWSACHIPTARKIGKDYGYDIPNLYEAIAKVCRLLEERGVLVNGISERDAVRTLCENIGVPMQL